MLRFGKRQGDQPRGEGQCVIRPVTSWKPKQKLLESSAVSAKKSGFSTVGVDGLMKAIGLSGGAFYSHFSSKDELFATIVERELCQSLARLGAGRRTETSSSAVSSMYLSMSHVEHPESGCALPALGAEIARSDVTGSSAGGTAGFVGFRKVGRDVLESDSLAWAILSQCIGALVVARMLATPDIQRTVLKSSYEEIGRQIAGPRT